MKGEEGRNVFNVQKQVYMWVNNAHHITSCDVLLNTVSPSIHSVLSDIEGDIESEM